MSSTSPKSAAGFPDTLGPDEPTYYSAEPQASQLESWQQAAEIFSAIANRLSAGLTIRETDPQNRAELIRKLDQLETVLRNGDAEDIDSLKSDLVRLEAGLRARREQGRDGGLIGQNTGRNRSGTDLDGDGEALDLPDRPGGRVQNYQEEGRQNEGSKASPIAGPLAALAQKQLNTLTRRIEVSHRQLAARLEAGLAAAVNETSSLKDLIAVTAKKHEEAAGTGQNPAAGTTLKEEIALLAGRLERAAEGFASLASLEQAIGTLSAQLEETRLIANSSKPPNAMQSPSEADDSTNIILRELKDLRAFHEDNWERVFLVLAGMQQSIDHFEKTAKNGAGLFGAGLPSAADPFAPILTSLAKQSPNAALATLIAQPERSDPALRDKEFGLGKARGLDPGVAANEDKAGPGQAHKGGENGSAPVLIEPGLGFPGRATRHEHEEGELHSNRPARNLPELESGANRTDFIAAARRAARMAQKEQQKGGGVKATSAPVGSTAVERSEDGLENGTGPLRGKRKLRAVSQRALVLAALLLFITLGGYVLTHTLAHKSFSDFLPELLKAFTLSARRSNPAAIEAAFLPDRPAGETSLSRSSQVQGLTHQAASDHAPAAHPGLPVAAGVDPLAQAAVTASQTYATARPGGPTPALQAIAGSDTIVADTLGPAGSLGVNNPTSRSARLPALPAFLQETRRQTADHLTSVAGTGASAIPPGAQPNKTLLEKAQSGDAAAQFELAIHYTEGSGVEHNYELAAQWFGKAAEQGLAKAEYRLGSLYEKGLGVGQDMQKAKNLYQRAAEKGNTRAMHNLGVLAVESNEGKPNYTSAALWFGKAAEYGIGDSQYNIAVLLARGLGLPKDLVRSYTWFAIVAASGDADAAKKRDEVAARLTSSELAAANAAALAFEPRPVDAASNEAAPPPAYQNAAPAASSIPQRSLVKPKISGL